MIGLARTWLARWRARRSSTGLSGWDNPATGHDLLAAMLAAKRRRKKPLP